MNFKNEVYSSFIVMLTNKINLLQQTLFDLNESAKNETKSTAGDKHETALAMLQIEQENVRRQIKQTQEQKVIFEKIDPSLQSPQVRIGSLVETDKDYFFVAAGIGKIILNDKTIIALSPQSPLGTKLMGLQKNDRIQMKAVEYEIKNIY
ncbi:MAG: hypothetical protein ABIT07_10870 [Ferruginibacter sp.]